MILRMLNQAMDTSGPVTIRNLPVFKSALSEAQENLMPSSERSQERIHNLPDVLGADLATMIGACQSLNAVAGRVEARSGAQFASPAQGGARFTYKGDRKDLSRIRAHTAELLLMSITLAGDFRRFVGVEQQSYQEAFDSARSVLSEKADD